MYYPKSQIEPNLYTNGEEFVYVGTITFYRGPYYKTSKGKYFTGNIPGDGNNLELELFETLETTENPGVETVTVLNSTYVQTIFGTDTLLIPKHIQPVPTEEEYTRGVFKRYFCKKTNQIQYLEIDKLTYENLVSQNSEYLWQNYLPFSIDWILTGSREQVSRTNQHNVQKISKELFLIKFGDFLKNDYLKYYK
jgi:hypothetical protein